MLRPGDYVQVRNPGREWWGNRAPKRGTILRTHHDEARVLFRHGTGDYLMKELILLVKGENG